MANDLTRDVLKVIARFTPVGEKWPVGVWVCNLGRAARWGWYLTRYSDSRHHDEMSELEANQKGIFRKADIASDCYAVKKD